MSSSRVKGGIIIRAHAPAATHAESSYLSTLTQKVTVPQLAFILSPLLVLFLFAIATIQITSGVRPVLAKETAGRMASPLHSSWRDVIESDIAHENIEEYFTLEVRPEIREVLKASISDAPRLEVRRSTAASILGQVLDIISKHSRRQPQAERLAQTIVAECIKSDCDPLFVAAVIKSESAFNERAVSHVGATGLMQIMPATGRYLAKYADPRDWPLPSKLTDPNYNIHLGVTYLKQLEEMYDGNRLLALIAYNWGPGKLDRAIRSGRGVPAETFRYALKILQDHNLWQKTTVVG